MPCHGALNKVSALHKEMHGIISDFFLVKTCSRPLRAWLAWWTTSAFIVTSSKDIATFVHLFDNQVRCSLKKGALYYAEMQTKNQWRTEEDSGSCGWNFHLSEILILKKPTTKREFSRFLQILNQRFWRSRMVSNLEGGPFSIH